MLIKKSITLQNFELFCDDRPVNVVKTESYFFTFWENRKFGGDQNPQFRDFFGNFPKFLFFYDTFIEETNSVANRESKIFRIEAREGKIYELEAGPGAITHGDRFTSHWKFYPLVCFFGLETFETYERK